MVGPHICAFQPVTFAKSLSRTSASLRRVSLGTLAMKSFTLTFVILVLSFALATRPSRLRSGHSGLLELKHQDRIDPDVGVAVVGTKLVAGLDSPVKVRTGDAAGSAGKAKELPLPDRVAGFHVDAAHMHGDGNEAMAEVEEDRTAFIVEVRIGKDDGAGHRG